MEYSFKINDFEGPLDLLLHLIKEKQMAILDIDVAIIATQYVDFIRQMQNFNLEIASEYLVMASHLVEIKVRSMLPKEDVVINDEYEQDERENLIKRLVEYKKYKDASLELDLMAQNRYGQFSKPIANLNEFRFVATESDLPNGLTIESLVKSLSKMYKRLADSKPLETTMARSEISIEDRIKEVEKIIETKTGKFKFTDLFEKVFNKYYFVVTLVAILDMAKHGKITVIQDYDFDDVYLERGKK